MLNIAYLLPIIAFWHTITAEIKKHKQDPGVANNMVSAIHCSLYLLQYNFNDKSAMNYAIHVSIGYFIYDLLYILRSIYIATINRQPQAQNHVVYVFHHIIVLYILNDTLTSIYADTLLCAYYLAEISNLTLYTSYHLRKEYPNHKTITVVFDVFQLLWYSYFRIIKTSLLLYYNAPQFFEYTLAGQSCVVIIHTMGILWTSRLIKKNLVNLASLNYKAKNDASTAATDAKYSSAG
jgi:TLC domain